MKSVVVEASTVAKAIELAWQKAEKPEEFFIRILQEHSSGFLGFGAKKAKIVFFFKNAEKSDSLFPVVLKQKEYASLFHNDKLKTPSQLNVVDNELNKNISLGQKKKQHAQGKPAYQARQATQDAKPSQQATQSKNQQPVKPQFNTTKTQVKLELPVKQVVKQEQVAVKEVAVKKPQVQVVKAPQAPKTVQTAQVVAPQVKVIQPVQEVVKHEVLTTPVSVPRVIPKMKRRPLTGADQGVSGITRSSGLKPSGLVKSSQLKPEVKAEDNKGEQE